MCGDRRHALLKSTELLGSWIPICFNCSALAAELRPLPQTVAKIREALTRNRRSKDRRWGKRDSRVFRYNRRGDDRRTPRAVSELGIEDDMIVEISDLASDMELLSLDLSENSRADLTRIQERPSDLDS